MKASRRKVTGLLLLALAFLAVALVCAHLAWRPQTKAYAPGLSGLSTEQIGLAADREMHRHGIEPKKYRRSVSVPKARNAGAKPEGAWSVRYYQNREPEEYRVILDPHGNPIRWTHKARKEAPFDLSHWAVLGLTAVVTVLLVFIAGRARSALVTRTIRYGLAAVAIASRTTALEIRYAHEGFSIQTGLPLQLCDFTLAATVLALCTEWPPAYEVAYFFGLVGPVMTILTPDLSVSFPDIRFVTFQAGHAAMIVSILFLTLAEGKRPWPRSILRACAAGQVYLILAGAVDWLTNGNYGYLRAKPSVATILDYFGPWPYYIGTMELVGLLWFAICYLPFFLRDARPSRTPGTLLPPSQAW